MRQPTRLLSSQGGQYGAALQEKKMLMWDLRTCQAQAALETPGQPFAVMDEEGLVFAVACTAGIVSMFDVRQYEGGPFLSFPLPLEAYGVNELAPIACMKFSSNQQHLLAVVEGHVFVMDTFDGREVVTWRTDVKEGGAAMEASFSADGQYVISGAHPLRDSWTLVLICGENACVVPDASRYVLHAAGVARMQGKQTGAFTCGSRRPWRRKASPRLLSRRSICSRSTRGRRIRACQRAPSSRRSARWP